MEYVETSEDGLSGAHLCSYYRSYVEILRDYEVAVYPRRDDSRDTSVPIPIEEEIEKGNIEVKGVTHIEVPLLDVSSTMVRQRIRRGEDITSLIPETVVAEVEKYSLYR